MLKFWSTPCVFGKLRKQYFSLGQLANLIGSGFCCALLETRALVLRL